MPWFFTLPPMGIPWPFIIINANRPDDGLRYLHRWRDVVEIVIVDSGVEIFRDESVRDYPGGFRAHAERLARLWRRVRSVVSHAEVYVTAPDYPDDYHPRSLWLSEKITNIERTLESVKHAIKQYPDIDWLVPIQGHYEKPASIVRSIELYEEHGVLDWVRENTRYVAVANLCVSRKCKIIEETVRLAWARLPRGIRIHVFGPAVNCVARIARLITSWDSMAWTRPRAPGAHSASNQTERAYLFITFLIRHGHLIDVPEHPRTMRLRLDKTKVKQP